jgi:hypothetical protein
VQKSREATRGCNDKAVMQSRTLAGRVPNLVNLIGWLNVGVAWVPGVEIVGLDAAFGAIWRSETPFPRF